MTAPQSRPWQRRPQRRRLAEIGPLLFREVRSKRIHVFLLELRGDRLHQWVLARPPLEVAKLQIEIAFVLPPDHLGLLVDWHAVLAMTGGAKLGILRDGRVLGGSSITRPQAMVLMIRRAAGRAQAGDVLRP